MTLAEIIPPYRASDLTATLARLRLARTVNPRHHIEPGQCVNPAHLEPITPTEQQARGSRRKVCNRGHRRTVENTYSYFQDGYMQRHCRDCSPRRHRPTPTQHKPHSTPYSQPTYPRSPSPSRPWSTNHQPNQPSSHPLRTVR